MPHNLFPTLEVMAAKEGIRFSAANGGSMGNYGRQKVTFTPRGEFSAGRPELFPNTYRS